MILARSPFFQEVQEVNAIRSGMYGRADGKRFLIAQFQEMADTASYSTLFGYRRSHRSHRQISKICLWLPCRMSAEDGGAGVVDTKSIAAIAAFILCSFEPAKHAHAPGRCSESPLGKVFSQRCPGSA
jgi:hypothetical protein